MAKLRALVVDPDEGFSALVRSALAGHGDEVVYVPPGHDPLNQIQLHQPDLVFIAVEEPGCEGFELFSHVKNADRRIRVVLSTQTLDPSEFSIHAKLKRRADLYLDKRTVSGSEIAQLVGSLKIAARPRMPLPECLVRADSGIPENWITELLEDGMDAETASALESLGLGTERLLAELLQEPERDQGDADPAASSSDAETPEELRQRLRSLERELDRVRARAEASPFSSGILALQENARRSIEDSRRARAELLQEKRRSARLRRAVGRLAQLLSGEQEQSRQLSRRVAEVSEEVARAKERAAFMESDLRREAEDLRERARQLEDALSREQLERAQVGERSRQELADLRSAHANLCGQMEAHHIAEMKRIEKKFKMEGEERAREERVRGQMSLERREADLKAEIAGLRSEVSDLRAAEENLRSVHASRLEELQAEAADHVTQARTQVAAAQEETERITADREKMKAECEVLRSSLAEIASERDRISELAGQLEHSFEAKGRDLEAIQEREREERLKRKHLEHQSESQAVEIKRLTKDEKLARERLSELASKMEVDAKMMDAIKKEYSNTLDELNKLRESVEKFQRDLDESRYELADRTANVNALTAELSDLKHMNTSLRLMVGDAYRGISQPTPSSDD